MPLVNVSMALMSPMLSDTFAVIRRQQAVGTNGRASFVATVIPNLGGVVYPSNKNDLERFPNLQVTAKTITVITRFALRSESETQPGYGETGSPIDYAPDIVQWNGDSFLVSAVEDWSNFGPGFTFAICQSMDLKDVPPVTE
jgi:galactose-6-phosphate isomerase